MAAGAMPNNSASVPRVLQHATQGSDQGGISSLHRQLMFNGHGQASPVNLKQLAGLPYAEFKQSVLGTPPKGLPAVRGLQA